MDRQGSIRLRGDAGQRALAAWSMGWAEAQEASGTDWMAPYLSALLLDPYGAVRFIAARSLRTLPAHADLRYDFAAPHSARPAATTIGTVASAARISAVDARHSA